MATRGVPSFKLSQDGFPLLGAERILAFSPHLDDAVLSAGAALASASMRGASVEVVTLFAGAPAGELSPVAQEFHRNCELPSDGSAMQARHVEDAAATAILGISPQHCSFHDAVFRRTRDGDWLCQSDRGMFQPPPAPEEELEENLRETIEQEMRRSAPDLVLTCAGVGSHIDHLLTRHAVLSATKEAAPQILLWEDLPYAGNPHERTSYPTESPSPYYADDVAWERKLHAVSCYTSQIGMLWPKGDWVEFLTQHAGRYASNKGQLAEVFWQYGG